MDSATSGHLHSRWSIIGRILAAALVVVASIGAKQLLHDGSSTSTKLYGARVVDDYSIDSKLIGRQLPVNVVIPRGARDGRRSLLVFLHGRGNDESSYLDDSMFAALARQKGKAPVVAFPQGDPDSYWHDRSSGAWGSYVVDELIPVLVKRFDIEPERIAIGGISMGGFGAVDLATRRPDMFCAVGGHSPAVWTNASDTAPGAFDNEADFNSHDVIAEVAASSDPLAGKRTWIDVGTEDPFATADGELADALRQGGAKVAFRSWAGAHEDSYWDAHWRAYMRFYAAALKACQRRPDAATGEAITAGAGVESGASRGASDPPQRPAKH